ncbi:MAG: radical SAM protein [Candidatus Woesearchaeota archaeon]|jgi:TatD family-associated radical SAM protein
MTIAYKFTTPIRPENTTYVNLIPNYSCVNNCLFCSRPRTPERYGKSVYEQKAGTSLYLQKVPTIEEIMQEFLSIYKSTDKEVAIVGVGEPLIYFSTVVEVLKKIQQQYNLRTRIDTNGLVLCWEPDAIRKLTEAGLNEIRISVNAITETEYVHLCQPRVFNAFTQLCTFVNQCSKSPIKTNTSFVINFNAQNISKRTPEEYISFAQSLGIRRENVILRNYVQEQ